MDTLIQSIAPHWHYKAPGVTDAALADLQARMSVRLPDDYRALLKWSNGGTAVLPSIAARKLEVAVWDAEKVADLNRDYRVQHYLGAQVMSFGDDGGGHHFLLDFRAGDTIPTVAAVPSGDLCEESVKPLAASVCEFFEKALRGEIAEDAL